MNARTGDLVVKITIKSFKFDDKLMEEHFNEKYLESDTYPYAIFAGKLNEKFADFKKTGPNPCTVSGKLNMHGVEKEITIRAVATFDGDLVNVESKFPIALKDYNITIPSVVAQNIAETVEVTVKGTFAEYKK